MADEADMQESEQDSSVEETTADSQSETQAQDSDANSTEQAGENQEGKADEGQADQSASTGDKSKSENQDSKKDSKPVSRRSAAYRINQLVEENKTLKQQLGKPVQEQDEWEQSAQEDDQPDIASLITKEVERRLHPVISESTKAADDAEINELFSGDKAGERPKYEPKIREMWNQAQYKDVAAADLYKIASFDDAVSAAVTKGIEEYKKADKEARESSASGSSNTSNRTGKGGKSVNDMTDEEFRQHNERVKAGQA
jgi:hypothetical protein